MKARPIREILSRNPLWEFTWLALLFFLYEAARYFVTGEVDEAVQNALLVATWEKAVGIYWEGWMQGLLLSYHGVLRVVNWFYLYAHLSVTLAFLGWVFVSRYPHYRFVRNFLLVTTTFAFVVHWAFPLAPPRSVTTLAIADTLQLLSRVHYGSDVLRWFINPFAAMPSLHFGWSLIVAYGVLKWASGRARWLILLYPAAMLGAIVVTGNHFILDAIVAGVVVGAAFFVLVATKRGRLRDSALGRFLWGPSRPGPTEAGT
ncbi:MAG: phosphatase PAP2 family protein [Methanobacteriota archaeon]